MLPLTEPSSNNIHNSLIKSSTVTDRSAVRCIGFHEKAFKLEMKFISLLC